MEKERIADLYVDDSYESSLARKIVKNSPVGDRIRFCPGDSLALFSRFGVSSLILNMYDTLREIRAEIYHLERLDEIGFL